MQVVIDIKSVTLEAQLDLVVRALTEEESNFVTPN